MKILQTIQDFITRLQVAYMRRKTLNRQLDGLTDPTFLDRALAGDHSDVDAQESAV